MLFFYAFYLSQNAVLTPLSLFKHLIKCDIYHKVLLIMEIEFVVSFTVFLLHLYYNLQSRPFIVYSKKMGLGLIELNLNIT